MTRIDKLLLAAGFFASRAACAASTPVPLCGSDNATLKPSQVYVYLVLPKSQQSDLWRSSAKEAICNSRAILKERISPLYPIPIQVPPDSENVCPSLKLQLSIARVGWQVSVTAYDLTCEAGPSWPATIMDMADRPQAADLQSSFASWLNGQFVGAPRPLAAIRLFDIIPVGERLRRSPFCKDEHCRDIQLFPQWDEDRLFAAYQKAKYELRSKDGKAEAVDADGKGCSGKTITVQANEPLDPTILGAFFLRSFEAAQSKNCVSLNPNASNK